MSFGRNRQICVLNCDLIKMFLHLKLSLLQIPPQERRQAVRPAGGQVFDVVATTSSDDIWGHISQQELASCLRAEQDASATGRNTQEGALMRRLPDSRVPPPSQPRQRPGPPSAAASSIFSASSLPAVAGNFRGMGRTTLTDSTISARARPLLPKTPAAVTVTLAQVMAACPMAHGSHSCTCGF